MENSLLNKAHEAGRRAVKLLRKGCYSEAAECHLEAAKILHDLEKKLSDKDSLVIRSLEEQRKFYNRQAELAVIIKDFQKFQVCKESSQENIQQKRKIMTHFPKNPSQSHLEILTQFDQADSLLQILQSKDKREFSSVMEYQKLRESVAERPTGVIRPKKDSDVIEELLTLNSTLRSLVDKLLSELNDSREENKALKEKLSKYESEERSIPLGSGAEMESKKSESIPIPSQYVPDIDNLSPPRLTIPELAPLETPEFDFSAFY